MFDIGFFEIILVSVVALVVLGPERLPGAVRTAGLWIGRLKRSFNSIKRDIEKEIGADEIRRQLRNEEIMARFDDTKSQFTNTIDSVKSKAESVKDDFDLKKQFDAVTGTSTDKNKTTEAEPKPDNNSAQNKDSNSASTSANSELSPESPTATKTPDQN